MKLELLTIQFLFYAAGGLFAPIWYRILIGQGDSQFGLLLGLSAFGSIGAAYLAGWLSHRGSTTRLLAMTTLLQGILILPYLLPLGLVALYGLQVAFGVLGAAILTLQHILVAKTTQGEDKSIGLYNSSMQAAGAITMVSSGFLASSIGDVGVVGISATILLISALMAWQLK